MTYKTEQELFWSGDFGDGYQDRNKSERLLMSNVVLFGRILRSAPGIKSIMELGCNIGLNLQALKRINSEFELSAYEINPSAASKANALNIADITCDTIINNIKPEKTFIVDPDFQTII